MKVKVQKTMFGDRYTFTYAYEFDGKSHDEDGTPYVTTTTIQFSPGRPLLVHGQSLTPIDEPLRFGAYGTNAERKAYCARFAVGTW